MQTFAIYNTTTKQHYGKSWPAILSFAATLQFISLSLSAVAHGLPAKAWLVPHFVLCGNQQIVVEPISLSAFPKLPP